MGFKKCIIPRGGSEKLEIPTGLTVYRVRNLREAIEVGDEVVTIGGIVGRVVSIKEDTLVVETSAERSKLRLARWAIQQNNTAVERANEARKAAAKEAKNAQ